MNPLNIRTDLALEAHEAILSNEKTKEINGISTEEIYHPDCNTTITKVHISSKNGANLMRKPMGHYITLESPELSEPHEDFHKEISHLLSKEVQSLLCSNLKKNQSNLLVIGLGNIEVTADSLGPRVVKQLSITRHLLKEYGKNAYASSQPYSVSSISPGVMAQTGMETAEIVKGIILHTHPDLLIAIDSLAARGIKRLNHTIQISDTGIQPGSGIGNHREGLTKESMGIPVIAIGIPMVVDAATIIFDFVHTAPKSEQIDFLPTMEKNVTFLQNMYVTGKNVDEMVRRLSYTISEGLNMAFANRERG